MKDRATDDPIEFVKMIVSQMTKGRASIQDFDDMVSEGLLGLVDAQKRYDPSKANGGKFSSYAEWRVRGAIIDATRKRRGRDGQKDIVDLYEPHGEEKRSLEEIEAAATYKDPNENLVLQDALSILNEREQKIVNLTLEGYNLEEIGDELEVSASRVSQLTDKIAETLGIGFSTLQVNEDLSPQGRRMLKMPEPSNKGKQKDPKVTERQTKVCELYNNKTPIKEIASILNLSITTVNNDIQYLKRITDGRSRYQPKIVHNNVVQLKPTQKVMATNKKDFREEIAHLLTQNNISKAKIAIILGLIDL